MSQLALYTFGILHELPEHPQISGFRDRGSGIGEAARAAHGFIRRVPGGLPTRDRPGPAPRFYRPREDPAAPQTLTVWRDLESAFAFSYRVRHGAALRHRAEWFRRRAWPTYVAWWIPDGHVPTCEEGIARLEHLHDHGPTPRAFSFTTAFDTADQPLPFTRPAAVTSAADGY
jgi:hypothetical protein